MSVLKKLISGRPMQELNRQQHGHLGGGDLLGVQDEIQAIAVWRVGDDVGDLLGSSKEVLPIKKVAGCNLISMLSQHSHNGTVATRRFQYEPREPLPLEQGLGGVRRCRVIVVG